MRLGSTNSPRVQTWLATVLALGTLLSLGPWTAYSQSPGVRVKLVCSPPDAEVWNAAQTQRYCSDATQSFLLKEDQLRSPSGKEMPVFQVILKRSGYKTTQQSLPTREIFDAAPGATVMLPTNGTTLSLTPTTWTQLRLPLGASGLLGFGVTLYFWQLRQRNKGTVASEVEPVSIESPTSSSPWELAPGSRIEQFELLERLGEGVSAVVYKCRSLNDSPTIEYALKLLKPSELRGADILPRFRREMKALQKLRHPNIPFLVEYGEYGNMLYLVMELLGSESLGLRIQAANAKSGTVGLPISESISILTQLCSALQCAHQQGILHRDIKPDNVVYGQDGVVRLTDFGLARSTDSTTLTVEGTLMGTPGYMAPELMQGERATPKADQYALGCLAYELLSGQTPFQGDSPLAIAVQHVTSPPPDLRELRPEVPAAVYKAVLRALEKSLDDRYDDCQQFAEALLAGP